MSSKTKTKHRGRRKEAKVETTNLAPVQDAVREYRVIEDSAYAYHLQEAEIEDHYSQNVNMRRLVQDDIRKAKELQDEEDRIARILTIDEEQQVKQMDEELAEFIQEEIYRKNVQEDQERKEREERDKELALLMEEKERRTVERVKRHEESDLQLAERLQNVNVTPPESRDEQRMRLMSDEELAKRLQREEKLKIERTKMKKKEMKSVVEMQDEELARYIHGKDVEAAEQKLRKEYAKGKSKKKGKLDNEPLYYDDNINPPDFHQLHSRPPRESSRPTNGYGQPLSSHDHHNHQPREEHCQRRREEPRHRHKDERRPDRPPPPKFSESHNTEVKVPLDSSQRRGDDRRSSKTSGAREYSRDHERSSFHRQEHRSHSERERHSRSSNDHSDMGHHRPASERHRDRPEHPRHDPWKPREHEPHPSDRPRDRRKPEHHGSHDNRNQSRREAEHRHQNGQPIPAPRGSRSERRSTPDPVKDLDKTGDLEYSENFARLTEEEIWKQNNNIKMKGSQKKKDSGCTQQ